MYAIFVLYVSYMYPACILHVSDTHTNADTDAGICCMCCIWEAYGRHLENIWEPSGKLWDTRKTSKINCVLQHLGSCSVQNSTSYCCRRQEWGTPHTFWHWLMELDSSKHWQRLIRFAIRTILRCAAEPLTLTTWHWPCEARVEQIIEDISRFWQSSCYGRLTPDKESC